MKKNICILILIVIALFAFEQITFNKSKPIIRSDTFKTQQEFYEFITDYNNSNIDLFSKKNSPLSANAISIFELSYQDLVNLRTNKESASKIDQFTFESATKEIQLLGDLLKQTFNCGKAKGLGKKLCEHQKYLDNAQFIYKTIKKQISKNKKIPYTNGREYFYSVCDSIFN